MRFTKVQGLGNDFILVDVLEESNLPNNLAKLAVRACDRHFGIGADGLVLIKPCNQADIAMQIFNSDGSEAEMCGNAIRCVAKYVYERGLVQRPQMKVKTLAGIMIPKLILDNGTVKAVQVDMGIPRLERQEIPMNGPGGRVINEPLQVGDQVFYVTAVSMGNPHCVVFVPDVEVVPLATLGPQLESNMAFPSKTNVEFVQVINNQEVRMRVWERGAGPTMACGTGACAAAVAASINGYTNNKVRVHLYDGALDIEWAVDNHVYMTGPAEEVFNGEYNLK